MPPLFAGYAWGTTQIAAAQTLSGQTDAEVLSYPQNANCNYSNITFYSPALMGPGPMRVGVFATGITNREQSGASYYGVMELSGNLLEQCVTLGNKSGRGFSGTHGNGELSSNLLSPGCATNNDWPGYTPLKQGVCGATGAGFRGGSWASTAVDDAAVADRVNAATIYDVTQRDGHIGGRCVRTGL